MGQATLNATYCVIFENNAIHNLENPSFAKTHHKEFGLRTDALAELERSLRQSGANTWGSTLARAAREEVLDLSTKLRLAILEMNSQIYSVIYRFDGPYNVAEWKSAAEKLPTLSLKEEAHALQAACAKLQQEIRTELSRIEPALHDATKVAFGFN